MSNVRIRNEHQIEVIAEVLLQYQNSVLIEHLEANEMDFG